MNKTIHFIRWEELPSFPLYIDQVISLIDDSLSFMKESEDDVLITNSMINNYVKHHFISSPIKKKYERPQIVYLIFITLCKEIYHLDAIEQICKTLYPQDTLETTYNAFCETFEKYDQIVNSHTKQVPVASTLEQQMILSILYHLQVLDQLH